VPQIGVGVPAVSDCPQGDTVCDCVVYKNCLPWGAYDGLKKLAKETYSYRRDREFSDDPADSSRARWYASEPDARYLGAWRTPSLRDVALTAPYMHDGLYPQLIDVVRHYNRGGAESGYAGQKAPQIAPLRLTSDEESDLVAFLETLTGAPLPADVTDDPCRRKARPTSCPKP
jgi:cytochrome c peroxidase